jgi:hypothetical protein
MKFIQLKRRKYLETWTYHDPEKRYFVKIILLPTLSTAENKYYYFYITFPNGTYYSSIDYKLYYNGLNKTIMAVEDWIAGNT